MFKSIELVHAESYVELVHAESYVEHVAPKIPTNMLYKVLALKNLWGQAVSEVRLRHPDPKVEVVTLLTPSPWDGRLTITLQMHNLANTANPDERFEKFHHREHVSSWPGYRAAKIFLCGAMILSMHHEVQELVTERGVPGTNYRVGRFAGTTERPVVDPHAMSSLSQVEIGKVDDIAGRIDWALGPGRGAHIINLNAARAAKELENEIAFVEGKVEKWQ